MPVERKRRLKKEIIDKVAQKAFACQSCHNDDGCCADKGCCTDKGCCQQARGGRASTIRGTTPNPER